MITIKLNKNNPKTNDIIKAIKANDGYCPCRIEKTEETKCICKDFQQQERGVCHCGLFIKED